MNGVTPISRHLWHWYIRNLILQRKLGKCGELLRTIQFCEERIAALKRKRCPNTTEIDVFDKVSVLGYVEEWRLTGVWSCVTVWRSNWSTSHTNILDNPPPIHSLSKWLLKRLLECQGISISVCDLTPNADPTRSVQAGESQYCVYRKQTQYKRESKRQLKFICRQSEINWRKQVDHCKHIGKAIPVQPGQALRASGIWGFHNF